MARRFGDYQPKLRENLNMAVPSPLPQGSGFFDPSARSGARSATTTGGGGDGGGGGFISSASRDRPRSDRRPDVNAFYDPFTGERIGTLL